MADERRRFCGRMRVHGPHTHAAYLCDGYSGEMPDPPHVASSPAVADGARERVAAALALHRHDGEPRLHYRGCESFRTYPDGTNRDCDCTASDDVAAALAASAPVPDDAPMPEDVDDAAQQAYLEAVEAQSGHPYYAAAQVAYRAGLARRPAGVDREALARQVESLTRAADRYASAGPAVAGPGHELLCDVREACAALASLLGGEQ